MSELNASLNEAGRLPVSLISIVWDPTLVTEDEYADIVAAIGDIVRNEGGVGVERVQAHGFGVACDMEVQP